MKKKILVFFLRFGLSVILLAALFSQQTIELSGILAIARTANLKLLAAGFAVFLSGLVACVFRWQMLLKGAGIRVVLRRVITAYAGGLFFNLFMPSTIGGDLMRSIDLSAYTRKPREVVATVVLDRLSGYVGLVIIAVAAIACGFNLVREPAVALAMAIIIAILIGILLALFNRRLYVLINWICQSKPGARTLASKIKNFVQRLHHEMYVFRDKKLLLARNVLLSVFIQLTAPVSMMYIASSIGIEAPRIAYFIYIPVISAITLLPISIGGLGLRDATTVYFFAKAGVDKEAAFTMSLCNFVFIVISAVLGGLLYVSTVRYRRIQSQ